MTLREARIAINWKWVFPTKSTFLEDFKSKDQIYQRRWTNPSALWRLVSQFFWARSFYISESAYCIERINKIWAKNMVSFWFWGGSKPLQIRNESVTVLQKNDGIGLSVTEVTPSIFLRFMSSQRLLKITVWKNTDYLLLSASRVGAAGTPAKPALFSSFKKSIFSSFLQFKNFQFLKIYKTA